MKPTIDQPFSADLLLYWSYPIPIKRSPTPPPHQQFKPPQPLHPHPQTSHPNPNRNSNHPIPQTNLPNQPTAPSIHPSIHLPNHHTRPPPPLIPPPQSNIRSHTPLYIYRNPNIKTLPNKPEIQLRINTAGVCMLVVLIMLFRADGLVVVEG